MKNVSFYLNIVLFIAVALLYIDRFTGNEAQTGQDNAKPGSSAEVVYINIDSLLNGYDLYNELKTSLMQEQQQSEKNLNSKSMAYQRKAMEFQQKVEKHLVTNSQAEQMQQQLINEQQNLVQFKDQLQMQLMEKEQSMNKQIFEKLTDFLKTYNKTKKHKIILGNSAGTNVLEADKNLDITTAVLTGLNKEYQKEGKTDVKTEVEDNK